MENSLLSFIPFSIYSDKKNLEGKKFNIFQWWLFIIDDHFDLLETLDLRVAFSSCDEFFMSKKSQINL